MAYWLWIIYQHFYAGEIYWQLELGVEKWGGGFCRELSPVVPFLRWLDSMSWSRACGERRKPRGGESWVTYLQPQLFFPPGCYFTAFFQLLGILKVSWSSGLKLLVTTSRDSLAKEFLLPPVSGVTGSLNTSRRKTSTLATAQKCSV